MEVRLTDEEIIALVSFWVSDKINDIHWLKMIADAQIAKLKAYYASLTREQVREEALGIIRRTRMVTANHMSSEEAVDQILSLVNGWWEAQKEKIGGENDGINANIKSPTF